MNSPSLKIVEPSDEQLLACWNAGLNTNEISKEFSYPEFLVERRLWRIREKRRAGT